MATSLKRLEDSEDLLDGYGARIGRDSRPQNPFARDLLSSNPRTATKDAIHNAAAASRAVTGGGGLAATLARWDRVSRGAPEAVVKVTFQHRGQRAVLGHLDYISRNGKLELEDDEGKTYVDRKDIRDITAEWGVERLEERTDSDKIKDTVNVIFSMQAGTNAAAVKDSVRETLKEVFPNNRFVFVLHEDQQHPHVHVVVKKTGRDRKRLRHSQKEIFEWRSTFARELRARGVEAEATPRYLRGQFKKAARQSVRQMRDDGRTPSVDFPATVVPGARTIRAKGKESAVNKFLDVQEKVASMGDLFLQSNETRALGERLKKMAAKAKSRVLGKAGLQPGEPGQEAVQIRTKKKSSPGSI